MTQRQFFDRMENGYARLLCAFGIHRLGNIRCGGWVCACGKENIKDDTYDWMMCEGESPN